ncbi:MAG: ABC transporter permease [Microbacterium sp.]
MVRRLLGRLLQSVLVLWAAFTVSFFVLFVLPSDPVALMLGQGGEGGVADTAAVDALRSQYGFDQPILVQYAQRLWAFVRLDFGTSLQDKQPVGEAVATALPSTLQLAVTAMALASVIGVAIAAVASTTRLSWLRQALLSLPPLGASLPPFWIGLLLIQFFAFQLRLLPSMGDNGWQSVILPALTLAFPASAVIAQILAKSFLSTWQQPFVQLARAKGLSRRELLTGHVLRHAIIPAVTMAAIIFGNLLAGTVVVETVFSRTGIGRLVESAVTQQDVPVVQLVVVLSALIFVVVNLAVDAVYPLLDPRIVRNRRRSPVRREGAVYV